MINLIFNILNFLVLLGVAYYLFKRYALPAISRAITFEKLFSDALFRQREELRKQEKNLEISSQRQQVEYQDLAEKIMRWHDDVDQKKHDAYERQKDIEQKVHQRREQQIHDQQLLNARIRVVPQAVEEARASLEKVFSQDALQRTYMTRILDYMRTNPVASNVASNVDRNAS